MMSMERRARPVLSNQPPSDGRAVAGDVMGVRWGKMQGWQPVATSSAPTLTFGVGLTQSGNMVDLDPATGTTIGGVREPPPNSRGYMRVNAAGVATWVETSIDGGTF
jgi:hypothetical protein